MSDTDGTEGTTSEPRRKQGGLGSEGTIPNEPDGVGLGVGEPTTFEPEEDPEAAANRGDGATGPGPSSDS